MKNKSKGKGKSKSKPFKVRNNIIRAAFSGEIDLKTKVEADKTKYNRKIKHKLRDTD